MAGVLTGLIWKVIFAFSQHNQASTTEHTIQILGASLCQHSGLQETLDGHDRNSSYQIVSPKSTELFFSLLYKRAHYVSSSQDDNLFLNTRPYGFLTSGIQMPFHYRGRRHLSPVEQC